MKNIVKITLLSLLFVGNGYHSVDGGIVNWFFGSTKNTTQKTTSNTIQYQKSRNLSLMGKMALFAGGVSGLHGLNAYGRMVTEKQKTFVEASDACIKDYKAAISPISDGMSACKDDIVKMYNSLSARSQALYNKLIVGLGSAKNAIVAHGHHAGFASLALLSLLLMYDTCDPAPAPQRRVVFGAAPAQTEISLHQRVHSLNKKLRLSSGSPWSLVLGVPAAVLCYDMFNSNTCGSLMPTSVAALGAAAVMALGLASYSIRELFGTAQNNQRSWLNTVFCKLGNGVECLGSLALATIVANALYGASVEVATTAS